MAGFDPYLLREAWAILRDDLREKGYHIRRGVCFEELESRIAKSEKPKLTEHFSTEKNTYTPTQAFWLYVETSAGEIVARNAVRLDDLGEMTLVDYWRKYWKRCYPGVDNPSAELANRQPRFGKKITGRVCYQGDLFVEPGHREAGVGSAITKLLQIDALDEWKPDYLYGWVAPKHIGTRLFPSYGFRAVHARGIHWEIPPSTIDADLTFVGNAADDLADLLLEITTSRPSLEST
ncbi:hypothetical protein [Roseibium sediminicola]|uniref:N-acetyltransferase domain-containing protein n=1 Tax=Roseibium sediminicola TaxID=2933272 RepID=A0ABT0H0K6_9HYPH|nr:hypothetical protein [Roseibium sp. CAU 1639]MCK7615217.1 hypothetical protein [Roseibium sp. CAU 1639]